jgi:hypothetical protein
LNFNSGFSFNSKVYQSLHIHEITHALAMSFKLGRIKAVEDECCGYIAEAICAKQAIGSDLGGKTPPLKAIRTKAFAIGESIVKGTI